MGVEEENIGRPFKKAINKSQECSRYEKLESKSILKF